MNSTPVWTENLTSMQFNYHYLSVRSNMYFIKEIDEPDKTYHVIIRLSLVKYISYPIYIVCIPLLLQYLVMSLFFLNMVLVYI